jgi:XTP/dITP diphosphohydrolase
MAHIFVTTSNSGKLRDFAGAAAAFGVEVAALPGLKSVPPPEETGATFEENARLKAEFYSRLAPSEIVIADDSGLEVEALNGAPGVHSARYAAMESQATGNSPDAANNARLLRDLAQCRHSSRTARFVCVIAAARNRQVLATFRGTAEGEIIATPRGHNGFGYDPLFLFPTLGKTFAELSAEEKAHYSHRGAAFKHFLGWMSSQR